MRKLACFCLFGVFFASSVAVSAAENRVRQICDPTLPENAGVCKDDTFEVIFGVDKASTVAVFEYTGAPPTTDIDVTIVTDTKSDKVQGWSYGVAHDTTALTIKEATIGGTDAETALIGGFDATSIDVEKCDTPACPNRTKGGGFISATVLSLKKPVQLTLGQRNAICKAKYTLTKDVGTTGTYIEITNLLAAVGSPPADINITIDGSSCKWTNATDGWIKLAGEPTGETNCDDGVDNDGDQQTDCCDSDCTTVAPCAAEETGALCTDGKDNDCDGATDAADTGCAAAPETNCDDGVDNDGDQQTDCCDSDCTTVAPCAAEETGALCTDGKDNDCDGKTDAADEGCAVTECPDWAYYFGTAATTDTVAVGAGTTFSISSRNATESPGFQLGVKATTAGASTTWEFASTLGVDDIRLVELLISDKDLNGMTPQTPNKATSDLATVSAVELGAATLPLDADDNLLVDLAPAVGGPGFTIGYIADMESQPPAGSTIPATAAGAACALNELLKVTLGGAVEVKFSRGDANGDTKLNVLDCVWVIQTILSNKAKKYACDDILDCNDDGTLSLADATVLIAWVFQNGPALPAPFRACANDATADTLVCTESNCE